MNVENLFDTAYFADAHNNNNISTGAPVNGRFTIRAKF
jgi:catecholate siderophore receptor